MKNLIDYSAVLRERERKQRAETVKSGIAQTAAFIAGIAIGIMIGIGIHLIP